MTVESSGWSICIFVYVALAPNGRGRDGKRTSIDSGRKGDTETSREGRQEMKWIAVLKPQDEAKGPLFNCESLVRKGTERRHKPKWRGHGLGEWIAGPLLGRQRLSRSFHRILHLSINSTAYPDISLAIKLSYVVAVLSNSKRTQIFAGI